LNVVLNDANCGAAVGNKLATANKDNSADLRAAEGDGLVTISATEVALAIPACRPPDGTVSVSPLLRMRPELVCPALTV
jgi:hypothetical protein